jgi:hypothetical protein
MSPAPEQIPNNSAVGARMQQRVAGRAHDHISRIAETLAEDAEERIFSLYLRQPVLAATLFVHTEIKQSLMSHRGFVKRIP